MRKKELIERAKRFLARVSYKPGTKFEVIGYSDKRTDDSIRFKVSFTRPDATNPEKEITISASAEPIHVTEPDPEKKMQEVLHKLVLSGEEHEANEYFRIDGDAPYDPHDPDKLRRNGAPESAVTYALASRRFDEMLKNLGVEL